MLAEKFILLDSLLFKLITTPEKETTLLTIAETLYHSSLYDGHLTIGDKFLIPGLIHYLR